MTLTVYTVSGAPRGWRVLLALALKDIDYDVKYLEASKSEHKSAGFLAINPRGTVPVLEADGLILRDSIAIIAWLERRFPATPLLGETPEEAAAIWQITLECCDYLRAAANDLLFPILVENRSVSSLEAAELDELQAAAKTALMECGLLEQLLGQQPYLAGQKASAAEAVAYPEVRLMQRALERKPDDMRALGLQKLFESYPRLAAWKERVGKLQGVEKTLPYHW